jgi:competence CoiA-like predicted nuclease
LILAKDKKGKFKTVSFSGEIGYCPLCRQQVIGKIYINKRNHFAHKSESDCAINTGIISDWHLNWQHKFDNSEINFPELGLRADVVLKNGTIIEFQHSDIQVKEIRNRENNYKKMFWLFDLTQFNKNNFFFGKDDFFYWEYPRTNWLYCIKPFFFHLPNNMIYQIREPEIIRSKNEYGYPKKFIKCKIWEIYTIEDFIKICYDLDNKKIKDYEILENLRYKNNEINRKT